MHLDTNYPWIQTPKFLCSSDELTNQFFRKELKQKAPDWYKWRWLQGTEYEACTKRKIDDFEDPMWFWISKRYRFGCGRLVESIESSSCINYVDLGGGWRVNLTGLDITYNERSHESNLLYLDFLYARKDYNGIIKPDGTKRLRVLLEYIAQMPKCPYACAILTPAGDDIIEPYGPNLRSYNFVRTKHTTRDLIRIYKRKLGAMRTNQEMHSQMEKLEMQPEEKFYWRVDCFKPIDPVLADHWPWPKVLEDNSNQLNNI